MEFEWDEEKDAQNRAKHGIRLARAAEIDWSLARAFPDERQDYGEERFIVRGFIGPRLYVMVFVLRGIATRVISLRKASRRERALHAKETGTSVRDT
jgi:uncharacterized protein